MKKQRRQSVTALPPSPDQDRKARMIKYTIAMSVRVVCVVLCFFLHGWWLLFAALGAIVLPYIAVVLANVSSSASQPEVVRPGSIVPVPHSPTGRDAE